MGWIRAGCETLFGLVIVAALRFVFAQLGANWFEMFRAAPDLVAAVSVTGALFVVTGLARAAALAS